jgi:opacity protein-like surface antigen
MKRWCIKLGIVTLVALNATPTFAKTIWIYGLNQASHFQTKAQGTYYIQVASFSSKSNAQKMRDRLSKRSDKPVVVKHTTSYYKVVIGPFSSAEEVKTASRRLQSISNSSNSMVHTKPRSIIHRPITLTKTNLKPQPSAAIANQEEIVYSRSGNWFAEIGVGQQWNRLNNSMLIANGSDFPAPFNLDIFTASNPSQTSLNVGGGYRWQRDALWFSAYGLGLSYKHIFSKDIQGTITEYSLPEFLNYDYSWSVDSDVVLATAKLNLLQKGRFSPYIKGGIGAAFNNTSHYSEYALPGVTPRISPAFADQDTSQFAYSAGAGLDFKFNTRLLLSIGYEFQDLGNIASGYGVTTWAGQSLNLGRYSSNEVVLNLSYLFGAQE